MKTGEARSQAKKLHLCFYENSSYCLRHHYRLRHFVGSAVLLFRLSGIDPHANASWSVMVLIIGYGILFSLLGGYVAQWISGTGNLIVNIILAIIIAGFATFSLFKTSGNHYSQFAAIFLFAPASLIGGLTRKRRIYV